MKRSLTLLLNGGKSNTMPLNDAVFLELETMDDRDLDNYISKKFNSSDEIRKKYAEKINAFLETHKDLIENVETETGRKFQGSIVITELHDDLTLERHKVIYKKHMAIFRQITKNKSFLLALENTDYLRYRKARDDKKPYNRIFCEYFAKELRFRCVDDKNFKRVSEQWAKAIKDAYYYYDIIRRTLKEYKERYKDFGLDSPDVVYSKYLESLTQRKKSEKDVVLEEELQSLEALKIPDRLSGDLMMHMDDYKEPPRFKSLADEEEYSGDLEKWSKEIQSTDDDETINEKGKSMTLRNGYSKMFEES